MKLYTFAAVAILAIIMAPVPQTQAGLLRNKRDIGSAVDVVVDNGKRAVNDVAETTAVILGGQLNKASGFVGDIANSKARGVGNFVNSATGFLGGIVNATAGLGGDNIQKQVGSAVNQVQNYVARGVGTSMDLVDHSINKAKKAIGDFVDRTIDAAGDIFHTDEPVEPNLINIPPNGKLVTLRGPDGKILGHLECDLVPIVEQLITTPGEEVLFRRSNKDKEVVVTTKAGDIITYFTGPIAHGIQNLRVHGPISVSLSCLGNVTNGRQDILDEYGQIIDNVTKYDITVLPNGVTLVRNDPLLNMLTNKNYDLYDGYDLIHLGGSNSGIKDESEDVVANVVDGVVDNGKTTAGAVGDNVNTVSGGKSGIKNGSDVVFGNVVHDIVDNGKSIVNDVAKTTAKVVGGKLNTVTGFMGNSANYISRKVGGVLNSATGFLGGIVNATSSLGGANFQKSVGGIINKVQNNIARGVGTMVDLVDHNVDTAQKAVGGLVDTSVDLAGDLLDTDAELMQPRVIDLPPKSKIVTLRGLDGTILGHLNGDLVPIVQKLITTPNDEIFFKRSNKDNEIVVTNKAGDILTYFTGPIAQGILKLSQPISVSISCLGNLRHGVQTILDESGRAIDKVTTRDVVVLLNGLALVRHTLLDMINDNVDLVDGVDLIHLHD